MRYGTGKNEKPAKLQYKKERQKKKGRKQDKNIR